MEEVIKMSLEDYPKFVNDDDPELAIARALFLSTRPNSHKFHLSEEVLRKYAPTILGKFLVGNLNIFESDVMSHEREPDIFGYIPPTQEVQFVKAEDGYLDAYVNIVVSKIYATKVYNLFLDDNFRNVSVEMRLMYSDDKTKDVAEFHIAGLTVLGKEINPSVPRAHMEMVRFSADDAEKYYNEHIVTCSENNFETEVLSKLNSIFDKLNLKEVTDNTENLEDKMAKLEEEVKDVVMDKPTEEVSEEVKQEEKDTEVKCAETEDKKDEEKEEAEKASDEPKSDDKTDEEKASDDSEDKKDEKDDKLAQAEAHCEELEAKCAELEAKLSVLEKFKADTEENEKMSIVNQTLAQVKDSMEESEYAKFEAKAKECTLENVNAWRNEVLANVATVLMSAKKDESHLRMNLENDSNVPTSLWDRM